MAGAAMRAAGGRTLGWSRFSPDRGFTLVEMTSSVAVMLIVMSAAWMLLNTSNDNLNRIDYGSRASEDNRMAFDRFERDLEHGVLAGKASAVLNADARSVSFMAEADSPADDLPELITWEATNDAKLVRRVQRLSVAPAARIGAMSDFTNGAVTSTTILTGLASETDLGGPMFTYARSATNADWQHTPGLIGLVNFHLRNGLPDKNSNVVDRNGTFRVIAFVINGY
jgi:prepilin-type N-terminal cleavage/methylation domain-containing protein